MRTGTQPMQTIQFLLTGPENPPALVPGQLPSMNPSATQPTVQRRMWHVQLPRQILKPPLMPSQDGHGIVGAGTPTRRNTARKQRANHRTVERLATLGRT